MKRVPILAAAMLALCVWSGVQAGTKSKAIHFETAVAEGDGAMAAGKHALAIKHYRQALTVRPRHAETRFSLGHAYQEAGRYYEARRNYRLAMIARSGNKIWEGRCRLRVAGCWEASKHYREALHEYRLALAAHPELAEAQAGQQRALAQVEN
jgi:tetratricopeptide (TPR) repeat protein